MKWILEKFFFLLFCTDHNKKNHKVFKQPVKFLFGFNPNFKIKPELFSTKLVNFGDIRLKRKIKTFVVFLCFLGKKGKLHLLVNWKII